MGIRQEQKEKRRQEILAAGLDVFIHKGYAAAKISDIAREVGMSVGLLFHYFESKEKLYENLIQIGISGPMRVIPPPDTEPMQYFENTTKQLFHYIKSEPFVAKMFVLMSQARYSDAVPDGAKDIVSKFDFFGPTAKLIQKGQKEGSIRDGDPHALSVAFWTSIQGIAEIIALVPETLCPDSEWIVDIIRRKS